MNFDAEPANEAQDMADRVRRAARIGV